MTDSDNINGKNFSDLYFRVFDGEHAALLQRLYDPNLPFKGDISAMISGYEEDKNSGKFNSAVMAKKIKQLEYIRDVDRTFANEGLSFDDGSVVTAYGMCMRYEHERISRDSQNGSNADTPEPRSLTRRILDAMKGFKLI